MFQKMLSIAVLALALSACSSDPTCEDVVDHVLKMAKDDMAKRFANLPEDQRKQIEEMAAKELTREKFLEQCKAKSTKEQLACMKKATNLTEIAACDTTAGTPPEGAPTPTAPEGTAPAAPEGAAPAAPEGAAPAAPEGAAPAAGGAQDPVGEGNAAEGANNGTPAAGAEGAAPEGE